MQPIRTTEELEALKAQESKLAEELLHDFPWRDEALAIIGDVWYRHGDAVKAEQSWNEALQINPKRADVHSSIAWLFFKKGDCEQSIAHYRKALEIQPGLSDVRTNIARALIMSGQHVEAITELEKEIQTAPESSFAFFLLGQAYSQQQQYAEARESYETAINIEPDYANAYYGLITACTKLGDRDMAKRYSAAFKQLKSEARENLQGRKAEYDDFAETQKNTATTYVNIGRMYREAGNLARAEAILKYGAGLDPNNILGYLELASLYQADGKPAKAIQMHRKIGEVQPQASISYLMIGMLSEQLQRYNDAEEYFSRLIEVDPQNTDGYRKLARLYLKTKKNLPQARQLAQKAVSLRASAANVFVFAWACHENKDRQAALAAIEQAMTLDPSNQEYRNLYQVIQQGK